MLNYSFLKARPDDLLLKKNSPYIKSSYNEIDSG